MKRSFLPFSLILLLAPVLQAQQQMDSLDKLTSARLAAFNRTQRGFFPEALSAIKDALKEAENRYGRTHPSVAPILQDLATLHRYQGEYKEAERALKWALALREKGLEEGDPLIAETQGHLAALYEDMGLYSEAAYHAQKALDLLEKASKGSVSSLVQALDRSGSIQLDLHHPAEAAAALKKSWALIEKSRSLPYPLRIHTLELLSRADQALGKTGAAEEWLQKALALAKASFPEDSIEVGDGSLSLGRFYRAAGKEDKAGPLLDKALGIYKRFVGVDYSYVTFPFLMRLAEAYQDTGDDRSAADLLEKALGAAKSSYGPQNPRTALVLMRLADAQSRSGAKAKAAAKAKEALSILAPLFPPDHPLVREAKEKAGR